MVVLVEVLIEVILQESLGVLVDLVEVLVDITIMPEHFLVD